VNLLVHYNYDKTKEINKYSKARTADIIVLIPFCLLFIKKLFFIISLKQIHFCGIIILFRNDIAVLVEYLVLNFMFRFQMVHYI